MARSRLPRDLLVLPILSVLVLALSVYLEAGDEPLRFARVYAGPLTDSFAGRVEVIEERGGVQRPVGGDPIRLEVTTPDAGYVRGLTTGPDGWADFLAPITEGTARLDVVVRDGAGLPLVAGQASLGLARWLAAASRREPVPARIVVAGHALSLRLTPPVLSVPFGGALSVGNPGKNPVFVRVAADGLELSSSPAFEIAPGASQRVSLQARGYSASVTFHVAAAFLQNLEDAGGAVEVGIPVVPGSLSLRAVSGGWEVLSPIERDDVYFAVAGPWGRGPGGRLSLGRRPDGTAVGYLAAAEIPARPDRYLVLSSAPDMRTPALVGLPLDGQRDTFDARDALLLDGGPRVRGAEVRRRSRVRWALGGYLAACGILCLILFGVHLGRAERKLAAELSQAGVSARAQDTSRLLPLLAVFSLFFAFSLAVLWIVAR